MKNLTFEQARLGFEEVFELAAAGEMIVIARNAERIAVHALPKSSEPEIAPPGYFKADYEGEEVAQMNAWASCGPKMPLL
jgi:hypothetical protein